MDPIILDPAGLRLLIVFTLFVMFVGIPLLLFVLYSVGIQFQRRTWWRWVRFICAIIAGIGLVVDVIANFTVLSILMLELPVVRQRGDSSVRQEWTFSTRLERLVMEHTWRTEIAINISLLLNFIAPKEYPHIHNVRLVRP